MPTAEPETTASEEPKAPETVVPETPETPAPEKKKPGRKPKDKNLSLTPYKELLADLLTSEFGRSLEDVETMMERYPLEISEGEDKGNMSLRGVAMALDSWMPAKTPKAASTGYPQGCPPENPLYGDKTPEVAQWLLENDPDAFRSRYAGRKVLGMVVPK